ncbi:MAG: glucose-1-phosphate cytidylyltransferase [Deltaproteobacteria bacterium]|nr:glucose-1-phosphate cytidylyltransferase [Deltaproteobacteria bacterium]
MKTVILAGGFGTRLSEETVLKAKPMVEIGGKPILWHILNLYGARGFNEFVLALGYKGETIKEYFLNFYALNNDISVDLSSGKTAVQSGRQPDWKVDLIDTGQHTMTGGRVKRLAKILSKEKTFMLTYGDGVSDIDVKKLVEFHQSHGKLATVTVVRPPARFGSVIFEGDRVEPQGSQRVVEFLEKPQTGEGWINGGFFVLNREVLEYIEGDETVWERDPLEKLARDGQLMAYRHEGFWQMMDTLRDKQLLESLWEKGDAPWKVWK